MEAKQHANVLLLDAENLLGRHSGNGTTGRPKGDQQPIVRSAVVVAYAAWEVYVEDSLLEAIDRLSTDTLRYADLPEATRAFLEKHHTSGPADLADDGWRGALRVAASAELRGTGGKSRGLNTADPDRVIKLQLQLLGYAVFTEVSWKGKSRDVVKAGIAELVDARGAIAHTGRTETPLHLRGARRHVSTVQKAVEDMDRRLEKWLDARFPTAPEGGD